MAYPVVLVAIGAVLLGSAVPAMAEQLTVPAIIDLTKSGLGDDAIVAKIKATRAHFDLGVDQMIDLRSKGVSSAVIAAMIAPPATSAAAAPVAFNPLSPDPMEPHPAGVYIASPHRMTKINPTVTNQAKTGGIFGYALTGGIASMSVKAAIPNESAKVSAPVRPTFYFFFDQAMEGQASSAWASGANMTVSSPAEFTLIRLMQKDGRREARVGSVNIGGAKSGVMDKDRLAFDYEEVRPGVFRVSAPGVIEPGEYGFIFALAGGGSNGAMTARIFDFAVR